MQAEWEEWKAWCVKLHTLHPAIAMSNTSSLQGDEGDSDDEELPFEASGQGGTALTLQSRHCHVILPTSTRAYNPGHSLFHASCLTKWRQNKGCSREISFRRMFCSLERARSTQFQFRPMWRRFELPASNAIRETCCIIGPPRLCALPNGLRTLGWR